LDEKTARSKAKAAVSECKESSCSLKESLSKFKERLAGDKAAAGGHKEVMRFSDREERQHSGAWGMLRHGCSWGKRSIENNEAIAR